MILSIHFFVFRGKTDTSLAMEAKVMRRWEFDSIGQAADSISSWFPGTLNERILLKEHLDATIGIHEFTIIICHLTASCLLLLEYDELKQIE